MSFVFDEPPLDELNKAIGGENWVLARRTPRILARYGGDVICLSPKQYAGADRTHSTQRWVRLIVL